MSDFGAEVDAIWPTVEDSLQPISVFGYQLLESCKTLEKPNPEATVDVSAFMEKSNHFVLKFGIDTCRVMSQSPDRHESIGRQIASVYPFIHERTLALYLQFLEHKKKWGNAVETRIYKNITLCEFVQRLLVKRCGSFYGRNDKYLRITGARGVSGFEPIGTTKEVKPMVLKNLLSYDEIKLSALLSISSHTEFINEGERKNGGRVEPNRSSFESEGVIVGIVGPRLSRRYQMEFQDIVIASLQNTEENGYGVALNTTARTRNEDYRHLWRNFYKAQDKLRKDTNINGHRYGISSNKQDVFDNLFLKRRYAISFDMLLLETEARAAAAGKLAYLHVVGFGLGVWKVSPRQEHVFLETFQQRLEVLNERLTHIGVVHFSWFHLDRCGALHEGALIRTLNHPEGGIRIHMSKRNPAEKLTMPEDSNMLLVVSYAWDGNALPGNEFWMKILRSTSDSAAACSSLITELHNPHINTEYCNAQNLHVVSLKHGVVHISEYAKRLLEAKE